MNKNWVQAPSIDICAIECGAKCCKSGYLSLTTKEKLRLQLLNPAIKWLKHDKTLWILDFEMNGGQCPNLAEDNSCNIYDQRPKACRTFPSAPYKECLIWPSTPAS